MNTTSRWLAWTAVLGVCHIWAAGQDMIGTALTADLIIVGIGIYLLPSIIGTWRSHRSAMAITAVNLFLGWTFLGWVAALVWSLTAVQRVEIKLALEQVASGAII